jgi:hypothetical protein
MSKSLVRQAAMVVLGGCCLIMAACGGGLTANSSCTDYLNASSQDQNDAVESIAGQLHAGNAVTPLGRPNIDYLCTQEPTATLGHVIQQTG